VRPEDNGHSKVHALPRARSTGWGHGKIVSRPEKCHYLDTTQLDRLEQSFRQEADGLLRKGLRWSRRRVLLIFLLIRYTGAKLSEVLALDPAVDFDFGRKTILFRRSGSAGEVTREVQISEALAREIADVLSDPDFKPLSRHLPFRVDPGFIRRKFYERAEACGFPKRTGSPEMIRRARAVELMQGNMPLPVVQRLLGHSSPNPASTYVSFLEEDIRQLTWMFLESESERRTSARNAFFGKIVDLRQGDIQSQVKLVTMEGHPIIAVITNNSLERLGLRKGQLVTAEVKAPWVSLQKGENEPVSSAENIFQGVIVQITVGQITSEYVIRIVEGYELCAIVANVGGKKPDFQKHDQVWALFNSNSVVLHID